MMEDLAGTASITSLFSYDLTDNGNHDIVVGRDDGKLQTYAVLEVLDEPELIAETVSISRATSLSCYAGEPCKLNVYQGAWSTTYPSTICSPPSSASCLRHRCPPPSSPRTRAAQTLRSAITSVAAGRVGNASRVDVVAATYSGVITGFSTSASHMARPEDRQLQLQERLGALKRELHELSSEKAGMETKLKTRPGEIRTDSLPACDVKDSLRLNENDGTHTLVIETAVALDTVVLRVRLHVTFMQKLPQQRCTGSRYGSLGILIQHSFHCAMQSSGAIGLMPPQDSGRVAFHEQKSGPDGGPTVGTYRCQSDVTRLELKLNTLEGQHSTLEAFIIPRTAPMVCLKRKYVICALSLHQLTSLPLDEQRWVADYYFPLAVHLPRSCSVYQTVCVAHLGRRPINTLKLTGSFSLAEIHAWMAMCFPGVEGTRPSGDAVSATYFSPFIGTQVECLYCDGMAEFKSDSLMTISILKDTITQEATKKKVSVKTASTTAEGSIAHSLSFLAPRFEHFHDLFSKMALLESVRVSEALLPWLLRCPAHDTAPVLTSVPSRALQELISQESNTDFLSEDQKHVLSNAQDIDGLGKEFPLQFESMCSMMERLYVDSFKFKGIDVRNKVPALRDHLEHYQGIEDLLDFFEDSG